MDVIVPRAVPGVPTAIIMLGARYFTGEMSPLTVPYQSCARPSSTVVEVGTTEIVPAPTEPPTATCATIPKRLRRVVYLPNVQSLWLRL